MVRSFLFRSGSSVGRAAYAIDPFDYLESITGENLDRDMLKSTHKK